MRVLLVSEGAHEEAGALEALVRRAVPRIDQCQWARVSDRRFQVQPGKGGGLYKRLLQWVLEARRSGFDALVLVIDEDGHRERIREVDQAQAEVDRTYHFPRALGIAIRSFDAWMLADESALTTVLQCPVQRQPSPEDNRDPKSSCRELRDAGSEQISLRDLYAKVSVCVDLQLLSERCPKGFGTFLGRLRSL